MIELAHLQILAAALFSIGLYGVLARRSAVLILMSIELMLNAVNINLIAAASYLNGIGRFDAFDGQIIAIFVITVVLSLSASAISSSLIFLLFFSTLSRIVVLMSHSLSSKILNSPL